MVSHFRPACLALALVATAGPAAAQTWTYEPNNGARAYDPQVYQQRYEPRYYNDARAYEPVVTGQPLALTPTQRTTINRTIIPQGRGRSPIVRERIVTERYAPEPILSERVVIGAADADYAYIARPRSSGERVIAQPVEASYAYVVGSRDASAPRYTYEYDGGDTANCQQRFRSYDPASGTYMGYDGMRHSCP